MNEPAATTGLVPATLTATTSTAPAACGGAVAVTWVSPVTAIAVAGTPPNVTPVTSASRTPEMVTVVPPAVGPDAGPIEAMAGRPTTSALTSSSSPGI